MRDHMAARIQAAVGRNDFSATAGEGFDDAYSCALGVLAGQAGSIRPDCYRGAESYLRNAEEMGADVPDYITATPEGTVWLEWTGADRCHVEILGDNHCERFMASTGKLSRWPITRNQADALKHMAPPNYRYLTFLAAGLGGLMLGMAAFAWLWRG